MTPQQKAQELVDKMERPLNDDYYLDFNNYAKECALIAVDEILKSNEDWDLEQNIWCDTGFFGDCQMYWIAVKQEILAL